MKIFSAAQIRQWDAYTIEHAPISSIDLMERAANACYNWLCQKFPGNNRYSVFCGTGNNGGDGLAIARMLLRSGNTVSVFILEGEKKSVDFSENFDRLKKVSSDIQFINSTDFHVIPTGTIVIEALFGSGISRPLQGLAADMVQYINEVCKTIVSIDIPAGLFADFPSTGSAVIRANYTLSFQCHKLAFLMAENSRYTGLIEVLDIGLHPIFYEQNVAVFNTIESRDIALVYKPRDQFLHKYNFGHALLYAGSKNMMGAAVLCAKACLRSGAGLVTLFTEEHTEPVIQIALPEAISTTETDLEKLWQKKSAIGIGPGLKLDDRNKQLFHTIVTDYNQGLVIDAAALQMLAEDSSVLKKRTSRPAILTPHTGEFAKLFGKTENDFERTQLALQKAAELQCFIVLKGHHTLIACPDGEAFFNTTGNAGMATAGSGDVLTGILTGLLTQGYTEKETCILGVYLHGLAGDIAAENLSQEAMISGDIIDCLGEAFKKINTMPGATK